MIVRPDEEGVSTPEARADPVSALEPVGSVSSLWVIGGPPLRTYLLEVHTIALTSALCYTKTPRGLQFIYTHIW